MLIDVTVFPKSGRFEVRPQGKMLKVYLKSAPESNKANIELVKELRKLLKAEVRIVSGFKSRKKRIEIGLTEEELKNMLGIS